jgi:hypothetical protein
VTTLMWEARAAAGRADDLVEFVLAHVDPSAQVFRSVQDSEVRVVVIDPTGRGVPEVDGALIARPPHAWPFEAIER